MCDAVFTGQGLGIFSVIECARNVTELWNTHVSTE